MADEKTKWAASLATVMTINSLGRQGYDYYTKWKQYRTFSMTLTSDAYIYEEVMVWLHSHTKSKTVKIKSRQTGIKLLHDQEGATKIDIDGYPIEVVLSTPSLEKVQISDATDFNEAMSPRIIFCSPSKDGMAKVTAFLEKMTEEKTKRSKDIHIYNYQTSYWNGKVLAERDLDSVFLRNGEKDALIEDIDTFLDNEGHYKKIGIPYHRGYLFYGEPGNGKSSLAAALASQYRMSVFNLPLSTVTSDRQLSDAIANVNPKSILLLEDIDIFSKSMGREQADASSPTLAGLLNALDGLSTPHGLITFMTTNVIDTLEPALIRPGRVDYRLELLGPDSYQIRSMFKYVYEEELNVNPREFGSMAELSDVFKRFRFDIEGARLAIKEG